jgi:hypothetical protein
MNPSERYEAVEELTLRLLDREVLPDQLADTVRSDEYLTELAISWRRLQLGQRSDGSRGDRGDLERLRCEIEELAEEYLSELVSLEAGEPVSRTEVIR